MPYFGTDYGICSIIKPQTVFSPDLQEMHYKVKTFGPEVKTFIENRGRGAEV